MEHQLGTRVIVIGADHHNTLAVVRCLGKKKCDQKILIHTEKTTPDQLCIAKSKYARHKTECVAESKEAILHWLWDNAADQKQILFPCSDLAAYIIDVNYEQLSSSFILPGFQNTPGRVAELMDKWQQCKFAEEHKLPMARTWKLTNAEGFHIPEDIIYPCIVKPEISAFGKKSDITICNDAQALTNALRKLMTDGYNMLIVQQFLHKEYEVCAYGCLVDRQEHCAGGMIRKVREFPVYGGGSLTFACFIDDQRVWAWRNAVLDILYTAGYRGQYDVEFLVCKEGVYLNEINFRHSGNGYALIQNGVMAPYIWCESAVGNQLPPTIKTSVKIGKFHMDELSDVRHLKDKQISLFTWLRDCLRTSAFAKLDFADLSGTFAYYGPVVRAIVNKIRGRL